MALADFRKYVEATHPTTCVSVNLLKMGKSSATKDPCPLSSHIVIDGEYSLNRLYGGYLGDWVCGGQWNRMLNFLRHLTENLSKNNIQVTVFFDGTSDPNRTKEWINKQVSAKKKMTSVISHLSYKRTQPPRTLWVPPTCLHTSLRIALMQLGVNVVVSLNDHRLELMNFVKENRCQGVMSDDPEYLAFDPPRLFSSGSLKMTFNGRVNALEYVMDDIVKALELERARIPIVSSLLQNHIMSAKDLFEFHRRLCGEAKKGHSNFVIVKAVVDFVRRLECVADLDLVSNLAFGDGKTEVKGKFKKSVRYYSLCDPPPSKTETVSNPYLVPNRNGSPKCDPRNVEDASTSSLETYHHVLGERETSSLSHIFSNKCEVGSEYSSFVSDDSFMSMGQDEFFVSTKPVTIADVPRRVKRKLSSADTRAMLEALSSEKLMVPEEVMKLARDRHRYGLMDSAIYRVLSTSEFLVPVAFEDVAGLELPCPGLFFRPLRQMVYSVLFDYHHRSNKSDVADPPQPIIVREWIWRDCNKFVKAEPVHSRSLGWPVPSISRLWFGNGPDDNNRRLRAFLSCMRSNNPMMWDTSSVPTRFIVLCSVLRYIVTNPDFPVLRKPELDAFLAQAVDPRRSSCGVDVSEIERIQLPSVNVRAVLLASLFMAGVENAVFANEACGAPIPLEFCSPCGYFDGKLFQETLLRAGACVNLIELCENRIHEVAMIECMREAIVEDVQVPYCRLPAAMLQQQLLKEPLLPAPAAMGHQMHFDYVDYGCPTAFGYDQYWMAPQSIRGSLSSLDHAPPPLKQTRIAANKCDGGGGLGRSNARFYPAGMSFAPKIGKGRGGSPQQQASTAAGSQENNYAAYRSLGRGCTMETRSNINMI